MKKTTHQGGILNMEIAKGYEKDTITGQMRYPCEMYQTTEQNAEQNTEKGKEQQTEQKSDNEEEE